MTTCPTAPGRPKRRAVFGPLRPPGRSYVLYAVLAAAFALVTHLPTHRFWGAVAAVGYLLASLLPARRAPAVASAACALLPLVVLAATGGAQLEVRVVEESAARLLDSGTPYHGAPAHAPDYNPYLPGMALFGLPAAVFGDGFFTDARWWFALCFAVPLLIAIRTAGTPGAGAVRHPNLLALLACPPVAMSLAVSGIDLPLIGLTCLGLLLAARGRAGSAGLLLGLASAMKWTAWPALAVACAVLGAVRGGRAVGRCALVAAAVLTALVAPVALRDPAAYAQHVIAFPLGLADAPTPAASPLPGQLLATALPGGSGRVVALALLAAGALLMAVSLFVRPPVTAPAAANRVALGLLLALTLAPASRFGYLLYPLVLFLFFRADSFRAGFFRPKPFRADSFRAGFFRPARGGRRTRRPARPGTAIGPFRPGT
ncbi:glycosyltransferase 87 family protein [Streptomyces sp. NPDC003860]